MSKKAKMRGAALAAPMPRALSAGQRLDRLLGNYLSTMAFLLGAYFICFELSPFHQRELTRDFNFAYIGLPLEPLGFSTSFVPVQWIFRLLIAIYAVVLIRFYLKYPYIRSKAYIFLRGLWPSIRREKGFSRDTKQAGLALLLKFFFAPLMINWCWGHIADMVGSVGRTLEMWGHTDTFRTLFDASLFWACFQLILFIDTFLFTLGYIIETPRLRNRIVTVEPTFFGWFICLACYPPFNGFTSQFFEWHSSDFPNFETTWLHVAAGVAALSLMGIYSWASVALGFKASNLTNRGIISHGPYKYVRHPAYTAKNLAWWIGATPIIIGAFNNGGMRTGLYAFGCTAAWSCIYALRAWTEERHLLMTDNGYAEYKKKVPYRFIPGVI